MIGSRVDVYCFFKPHWSLFSLSIDGKSIHYSKIPDMQQHQTNNGILMILKLRGSHGPKTKLFKIDNTNEVETRHAWMIIF